METLPTPLTGSAARRCPICGEDNHCETARTGCYTEDCWCRSQHFPAGLLNRPETVNRDSCICRRCAQAAQRVEESR